MALPPVPYNAPISNQDGTPTNIWSAFFRQLLASIGSSVTGVTSVFTRTGAVTAQSGDYTATQITNAPSGNIVSSNVQAALNEVQTHVDTHTTAIALKAPLASPGFTGTPTAPTATIGTNTTQLATTAFVLANASAATWGSITGTLSSQSDLNTALGLKAPLASPALTGTPTAPTATANTNTTQVATTAYTDGAVSTLSTSVNSSLALKAPLASPALTGVPTAPTATPATNTTQVATTAYADAIAALKANVASPTFTGTPAAPTAAGGTNTTQIATTAFVTSAVTTAAAVTSLTGDVTGTGPGATATTIAANVVANTKLAQMAAHTYKGNNTGSTANAADITSTQLTADLNVMVGDSGAGGTKGLVPAPSSGDAAAGKFLKADGTFAVPPGTGGATFYPPAIQKFTSGSGTYNKDYTFVITSGNATVGATYTNNGITFTVYATVAASTTVIMSGSGAPAASGTLTKTGGTGDATLAFSAFKAPLYLRVKMVGGGAGGDGSSTQAANNNGPGGAGGTTTFGTSLLVANGGSAGGTGGGRSSNASAGGTASLGTGPIGTALQGGSGGTGGIANDTAGGVGGASRFGGAGAAGRGNGMNAGQNAVANSGSGGGGAGIGTSAQSGNGGAAGGFVDAIIYSPSATYTYAVGAAGTAGTAGTSGAAGGAGGSGYIEVTEYYQ